VGVTFTDLFCGAGGSSIGLAAAGFELKLAANHWDRAIETHAANFTQAEHLLADVSNYDMRRLPRTDVLWASPICTENSPAGGKTVARPRRGQLDLLEDGPVAQAGFERTRATFHDVIRATEVHRYLAVIVENVVDVATRWELFDWWVRGMDLLGYRHQIISVSSAHIGGSGNPYAPQWRDRLYIVFTRDGVPLPDIDPHPQAWCPSCEVNVAAVQWWKNPRGRGVGKYGQQYLYRCPNSRCRHQVVEPYVLPAADAIDWTDLGTRIGDRRRPLAESTMRRIRAGLQLFSAPVVVAHHGNTWERPGSGYTRAWPAELAPLVARTGTPGDALACPPLVVNTHHDNDRVHPAHEAPLPARTVKIGESLAVPPLLVPAGGTWNTEPSPVDGPMRTRTARDMEALVCAPFLTMLRGTNLPKVLGEPMDTVAAQGRHHYLTVPDGAFHLKINAGNCLPGQATAPVSEPLGAVTARDTTALVIPYRRTNQPTTTAEPLHALHTRDSAALVRPEIAVEECRFRMLQPREHLRAQRFPDTYVVHGNKGEQTMQAGNAVSANVAQWLGQRLAEVLG
jgi:DNA (cytosine-5)-methyltransferase 1